MSDSEKKNKLHPKKLLNSKWTAVKPINKQKHFMVSDVQYNEDNVIVYCELQALINKDVFSIDWRELRNTEKWIQGWK